MLEETRCNDCKDEWFNKGKAFGEMIGFKQGIKEFNADSFCKGIIASISIMGIIKILSEYLGFWGGK